MFLGLSVSPIQPAHRAMPKQRSAVAFGDSLTAGAGASSPYHSYPALAASLFDPPRIILNRGMGGQTSTQIAARQGGKPLLLAVQGPESKNLFPRTRDWMASFDAGVINGLAHELVALGHRRRRAPLRRRSHSWNSDRHVHGCRTTDIWLHSRKPRSRTR
ncbi:SGNH/GDSL hydrolase family protein [Rhizobium sp. R693]|uniref:SGNH/GDSL hydrolase family protein n=1 Tax=Rhizobium sp. R693 TaxID=1764276 RepID=UPI0011310682|nr:SGNH/GDSL hydrolase family protein [Rhizobium sp. R693]